MRPPLRLLAALLALLAAGLLPAAGIPLIDFNESVTTENHVETTMLTRADGKLAVQADNFWSFRFQMQDLPPVPLPAEPAAHVLELELQGRVYDEKPFLTVVLFNRDWSRKTEYRVPLADLRADAFGRFRATTPLLSASPAADQLQPKDEIEHIFINGGAELGNQPWALSIQAIRLVPATAKP